MTDFVYVVRLPADDFTETHVFPDWETARIVKDAIDGAQCEEQPILDAAFARYLVEQNGEVFDASSIEADPMKAQQRGE